MPKDAGKSPARQSRNNNNKQIIIGLIGKAGSGKTEVGKIFQKLGATFIDADKIVHRLYGKKRIVKEIVKHFGEEVSQKGIIDRNKLRHTALKSKEKLRELECIVWPAVKKEMEKIISKTKGVIIIEAVKLYEGGMKKVIDKFVLVEAKKNVRLNRLKSKLNELAIKQIEKIQRTRYPFDYKIINSASLPELEKRVKKAFKSFKV